MATRKMVNVDEEALRLIMANDRQTYLSDDLNTPVDEKVDKTPVVTEVAPEPKSEMEYKPKPEMEHKQEPAPEVETTPKPVEVEKNCPSPVSNPNPDTEQSKIQKKRKGQKADFSELFLKERTVKNKKQIYISVETYDVIRSYLKYIGDVSFIAYVDNILVQHIEEHRDTISELFDKKVKPF